MHNLKFEEKKLSVKGYKWQKKTLTTSFKQKIIDKFNVSNVIAEIIATKFTDLDDVENFVNATLKQNMKDPFILKDMKKGVELVIKAILQKKNIVIFADYDVDGATSAALFKNYFRKIGSKIDIYIPDRIIEGYGPNSNALLKLKQQNKDLVITLDCGTTAFEPLEAASNAGLDVIVIDHHLGTKETPKALAIINPNRVDESGEYSYLCAAGVSFLFLIALNNMLEQEGFFDHIEKPNLLELLDLAAIGTICDMVPLTNLNRAVVKQGLKILRQTNRAGIRALSAVSGCNLADVDSYHLGFVIGPRINAGGRVATSNLGAELLSTDNYEEAYKIAIQLELHNKERKAIEQMVQEEAIAQIEQNKLDRKSTRLNSSHSQQSRMPSSA